MVKHNVTVEDSSPLVIYPQISLWHDSPRTFDFRNYSGYASLFETSHRTTGVTTVQFPFNGTGIYIFGTKSPLGGTYNVSLFPSVAYSDGHTSVPQIPYNTSQPETFVFSAKAAETLYQQPLFAYTGLDPSTPHHLEIGNYGFGEFILDFIVVESDIDTSSVKGGNGTLREITLDDSDMHAFTYAGGPWTTDLSQDEVKDLLFNETQHMTSTVNATALLKFRGSGVALHGQYSNGSFLAQLDRNPPVLVQSSYHPDSDPSAPDRPRELLFAVEGLAEDNHQLMLTNTGDALNVDFAVISTADPSNQSGLQSLQSLHAGANQSHSKASPGLIVGAVVACLALLLIAGVGVYYIMVRRRRRRNNVHPIDLDDEGEVGFGPAEKIAPWDRPPAPQPFLLGQPADLQNRSSRRSSSISSLSLSDFAPIPPPLVPEGPIAPPPPPQLYRMQAEYVGGARGRAAAFPPAPIIIRHEEDGGVSLDPATPQPVSRLLLPPRARARRPITSLPPIYDTSWGGGTGVGVGSPGPKSAFRIMP